MCCFESWWGRRYYFVLVCSVIKMIYHSFGCLQVLEECQKIYLILYASHTNKILNKFSFKHPYQHLISPER